MNCTLRLCWPGPAQVSREEGNISDQKNLFDRGSHAVGTARATGRIVEAWSRRVETRYSTTTWGAARWQQALAAVVTAVIFWPHSSVDPAVGLDPSWQAGVSLAWARGLAWGPDVVFTAGPLGFLRNTPFYAFDQSVLASAYQLIVVGALFLGIATAMRLRLAPLTSLIGAFIATGITAILHVAQSANLGLLYPSAALGMAYPELAVLAAFAWASLPLLQQEPKRSTVFTTCVVLGTVAAFQLMVKFNTGLNILAIALAMSLLSDVKAVRRHCATVTAFALSTVIWWLLVGQRFGDLPDWLRSSSTIISGYVDAQAIPLQPNAIPAIVFSLGWIGALCVVFWRGTPQIPRRFVVLVGLTAVIVARSVFARYDPPHFGILPTPIVVAVAIAPISATRRAIAAATVVLAFAYTVGPLVVHDYVVSAAQAPTQGVDRLVTLALPGRVGQRIERAKARQRGLYGIPDRFIETIGSGTVHVDPAEISAVWAYNLAWRPAPVFQSYSAYTPALDKLNSDTLARGPQFVLSLQSPTSPARSVDGRLGVQESPLYSRALLCNYTVSGIANHWALFTRTGSHCGPLNALSEVTVHGGETITVPTASGPHMAVLVGIDLDPTILDSLFQGTVIPLTFFTVALDGVTYRLVAANAAQPFLVSSPNSVDGTNLEIHAHTIGVGRIRALGQSAVHARLRFFEVRVDQ
jgi:hypothetical protein